MLKSDRHQPFSKPSSLTMTGKLCTWQRLTDLVVGPVCSIALIGCWRLTTANFAEMERLGGMILVDENAQSVAAGQCPWWSRRRELPPINACMALGHVVAETGTTIYTLFNLAYKVHVKATHDIDSKADAVSVREMFFSCFGEPNVTNWFRQRQSSLTRTSRVPCYNDIIQD